MPTSTTPRSTKPDPPPESLAAALAILQTRLPKIGKDSPGMVRDGKRIMYANLPAISERILPLLGELGLSFSARPTLVDGGRFVLAYTLRHVSGDHDDGEYPLPSQGTPQQVGSAITYARRQCLTAVTGVAPDDGSDDDAQAAESAPQRTPTDAELRGPDLRAHNRLARAGEPHVQDITDGKLQFKAKPDPAGTWAAVDANGERRPPGEFTTTYPPGHKQIGWIQGHFKRLGFTDADRQERLDITGLISGRGEITTTSVLTQDEVQTVLKVLEKFRDRAALDDAVAKLRESEDAGA